MGLCYGNDLRRRVVAAIDDGSGGGGAVLDCTFDGDPLASALARGWLGGT